MYNRFVFRYIYINYTSHTTESGETPTWDAEDNTSHAYHNTNPVVQMSSKLCDNYQARLLPWFLYHEFCVWRRNNDVESKC
jgi:hypothetical protein